MNTTHKDFIGTYENVYPEGYCQHLINEFENLASIGAGSTRAQSENAPKHRKDDLQIFLNMNLHSVNMFEGQHVSNIFFDGLQKCFDQYASEYSILREDRITATHMKMQRTGPGGGYHIWHGERSAGLSSQRVLVYSLYLNTLSSDEGGETEFLYQRLRIPPKENTMIVWPAAFTHTHRGNTVLGNNFKYIITGWFHYEK